MWVGSDKVEYLEYLLGIVEDEQDNLVVVLDRLWGLVEGCNPVEVGNNCLADCTFF